jgi:hypothetical protein
MKNCHSLQSHTWASDTPHKILQDERTIAHQRCLSCGRDFGLELDGSGWHAVYVGVFVGVFRVERLVEEVNQRWLSEECPKRVPPADEIDRASRVDGV